MKTAWMQSIVAGISLLGLAACQATIESRETTATTREFGETVIGTMSNQIVDPLPVDTASPPDMDGDRAALAMQRYKTNTTLRPRAVTTGSVGGGR